MKEEDWRFCKKCLIRDFDEGELFQTIQDYISRMEPEIKTLPEEYEHRLAVCRKCEKLLGGMCGACGCYVELRAAVKKQYCPNVKKRW